jgi:hypothetical protein
MMVPDLPFGLACDAKSAKVHAMGSVDPFHTTPAFARAVLAIDLARITLPISHIPPAARGV